MSSHHSQLSWDLAAGRLRLRVADPMLAGLDHGFDVPAEITAELEDLLDRELTAPATTLLGGDHLSSDPAGDLIRLESHLRRQAALAERTVAQLRQTVETLPAEPAGHLVDTTNELAAAVDARDQARHLIHVVREFVIAVDPPDGLLAQTRDGWLFDPNRPPFVSMYASENLFAIADPRRITPNPDRDRKGGGTGDQRVVAGEQFGVGWRRDGDDDDPDTDEPAVIGPWQLCYLPATGEVYATRRCHYLPPEVWLLGRRFVNAEQTRRMLSDLKQDMNQPNSLILAAHAIEEAARRSPYFRYRDNGHGGYTTEPLGWT
jgi:hypothetical protein